MNKFPIYKQLYSMDCGAACVKMVANYYGKQPPIEFLENLCQVGTEGVSMKGMCTALDRLGFRTVAGKITLENLRDKALLPCILHWNQNHFVVLYKIRKRRGGYRYMIADPGMDLVEYSEKEFKDSWISTNSSGEDKGMISHSKRDPRSAKLPRAVSFKYRINID